MKFHMRLKISIIDNIVFKDEASWWIKYSISRMMQFIRWLFISVRKKRILNILLWRDGHDVFYFSNPYRKQNITFKFQRTWVQNGSTMPILQDECIHVEITVACEIQCECILKKKVPWIFYKTISEIRDFLWNVSILYIFERPLYQYYFPVSNLDVASKPWHIRQFKSLNERHLTRSTSLFGNVESLRFEMWQLFKKWLFSIVFKTAILDMMRMMSVTVWAYHVSFILNNISSIRLRPQDDDIRSLDIKCDIQKYQHRFSISKSEIN